LGHGKTKEKRKGEGVAPFPGVDGKAEFAPKSQGYKKEKGGEVSKGQFSVRKGRKRKREATRDRSKGYLRKRKKKGGGERDLRVQMLLIHLPRKGRRGGGRRV